MATQESEPSRTGSAAATTAVFERTDARRLAESATTITTFDRAAAVVLTVGFNFIPAAVGLQAAAPLLLFLLAATGGLLGPVAKNLFVTQAQRAGLDGRATEHVWRRFLGCRLASFFMTRDEQIVAITQAFTRR